MKAVQLAFSAFLLRILRKAIVLMSDNTTVVAYLQKQGGMFPGCYAVWHRRSGLGQNSTLTLLVRYIMGKNILVDQLSHPDQVLPTVWFPLPLVSYAICEVFDCPHIYSFATRANMKLPLYVVCSSGSNGVESRCFSAFYGGMISVPMRFSPLLF